MNKVYQVVWNKAKGVWQAASELSQRGGKGSGSGSLGSTRTIAAGTLFLIVLPLHAADLPTGGQVVGGQGSISSSGNTLTVNQNSQNLTVNWQDFSIAEGHTVNFVQPNAQAAALNRVTGNNVSDIRGALNANGRVFLVNPNGVMFSSTARVDVGSLVASTLDISTEDFMAGNYQFQGASANAIINQGNITTAAGGVVAMIAAKIINTGNITTPSGSTLMGAGNKVTLDLGGPVKIEVEEALLDTYIEQGGAIRADGGLVYLTAKAAGNLAASVINHTGVTEARTLAAGVDGRIMLMGDMEHGQLQVAGTLDASAPTTGNGGLIETSAAKVQVKDVKVTTRAENGQTGEWLIDPTDIEIVAGTGGDVSDDPLTSTSSSIGADTLVANLANSNITVQTPADGEQEGNITVSADIVWNANTTLTLDAHNEIYVNATIENTNTTGGGVYFNTTATYDSYDYTDNVIFAQDAKVVIHNVEQLQWISQALGGNYELGSDIDASVTSTWNGGLGFNPIKQVVTVENDIGFPGPPGLGGTIEKTFGFTGRFDGRGHTIDGLTINRPSEDYVGLFGQVGGYFSQASAELKNIGLANINITGHNLTGAIAGNALNSSLLSVYASGSVSGYGQVGGLIGSNDGNISNSYATGAVSGDWLVGGLVGYSTGGSISNSYASNNVSETGGDGDVGGLVGLNFSTITSSYFDSEANTGSMRDNALGKTKAEILSNANTHWDGSIWATSGAGLSGYATDSFNLPVLAALFKPSETLFEGGYGTEQNPYTITDWNQLQNINYNNNLLTNGYYFALSNNLGSASTGYADQASSSANGGTGWNPIGSRPNQFNGTFDGQGHSVSDLAITRDNVDYQGFFGYTNNATVKNINLVNANVSGKNNVGALVGYAYITHIENASSSGAVSGSSYVGGLVGFMEESVVTVLNSYSSANVSGADAVGGLVGQLNGSRIAQSYATGDVVATGGSAGGLVGYNQFATIENAYATGSVNGNQLAGGLVGFNRYSTIENAYATGEVSGAGTAGGLAGGAQGGTITNSFWNIETSNQSESAGGAGKTTAQLLEKSTYEGWDDTVWSFGAGKAVEGYGISRAFLTNVTRVEDRPEQSTLFSGGWGGLTGAEQTGADGSAYTITTGQQLQNINLVASQKFDFALSNDIDLKDVTWTPIGSRSNEFSGTFDGQGHSLSNLVISQPEQDYIGLFGYTSGATIKNVGLVAVNVTGSSIVGALAGYANNSTTISNVYAIGTVSGADKWIGGLVGLTANNSSITQSYATSVVTGGDAVGGLVGLAANSSIEESYASGAVTGNASVGGLVGTFSAVPGGAGNTSVTNSFWNTETSGQTTSAGGTGKTTAELQSASTFAGWDLSTTGGSGVWRLYEGQASPLLRSFMTVATVSGNGDPVSRVYDASTKVDNALLGLGWVTADGSHFDSSLLQGNGFSLDSKDVGSRNLTHDFYSGQTGYDIVVDTSLSGKQVEVTPFALSLDGLSAADKTYDGSKAATLVGTGSINAFEGDSITLSGTASGSFADKNAEIGKAVSLTGLGLEGTDAANYTLTLPTNLTATINQKAITISGISAADKIYDAGTSAIVDVSNASGWIAGDDVQVSATGQFVDKNAEANKTVNLTSSYSGDDADNYLITDQGSTIASIDRRSIKVTADNLGKDEGALDPALTYQTGCGASITDCGLVDGESLFGELNREAGETAGNYAIRQGSVDDESNPNYDIEFEEGALVITKVDIPDIGGGDTSGGNEESSNSHLSQIAIAVIQQQTSGGGGIGPDANSGAPFRLSSLADTNRSDSGFSQSGGLELVETDEEGIKSNVRRSSPSQYGRLTQVMVVQGGIRLANGFTNLNQD
ncbi:two-partner secretion domain-containing protein [Stutzerimonas nitrititolerans]|uniref:two-partner secretion domain-containing protein n=1 Tax=Stutzerimonas nitrititolerans TaxID=2482751 RepID=UPI00289A3728|nr:GLUG motif-containing protein [Stutzerimonas nitrititolerans]